MKTSDSKPFSNIFGPNGSTIKSGTPNAFPVAEHLFSGAVHLRIADGRHLPALQGHFPGGATFWGWVSEWFDMI